jgi:hypothetical protein
VIFSSDNQIRIIDGFQQCTSLCRIEIPASVEEIGQSGFRECLSLNSVLFPSDSHLRIIEGFQQCTSLCRIEIPTSVEEIGQSGFRGCSSLNDVIFSWDSRLRRIAGFEQCRVLCRIEIPASVEILTVFDDRVSLQEFHFPRRTKMKKVIGNRGFFVIECIEDFLNLSRRRVQLGCSLLDSKFNKSKSI